MEWSKIKNIIILILLLVNAFLLALVCVRETRTARYEEETRAGAVAVLEKNQIAFALEQVPEDSTLTALNFTRDREGEQAVAEALLGPLEEQAESTGVRQVYAGPGGTAEFAGGGDFIITPAPGVCALGDDTPEQASRACLERMGFQGELVRAVEEPAQADGQVQTVVTYRQTWEGVSVFSCRVNLTWRDGALVQIRGQRLSGAAAAAGGEPCLSTATVLIRFLAGINEGGYVCSRIEDMSLGYRVSGASRPVLTPVWRIATDTWSYYVDGVTGELSLSDEGQ